MWRKLLDRRFERSPRTCFERLWDSPRRPLRRRSPLVFQPLEQRLLLSADLAPVEGVLEVLGTPENDSVLIAALEDRLTVVRNGESFDFALRDIKEIKIDLMGGDDALASSFRDTTSSVRLTAMLGAGDDSVSYGLSHLVQQGLSPVAALFDLGEGNNQFDARFLNTFGAVHVTASGVFENAGSFALGGSLVLTQDADAHGLLGSVTGGEGRDVVTIDMSQLTIAGAMREPLIGFEIDGGPGDDITKVALPVASQGGAGQEPTDPAERRAPVSVRNDSRAGSDSFALIGGDAAEQYDIRAFDDAEHGRSFEFAAMDLGTGNPLVEAAVLTVTHVAIDTGAGNDLMQGRILLDADWNVELGEGDDSLDIETLIGDVFGEAHYRVDAGEGDNETTLRFGDGEHGARPPSGATNVTAEYRSGSGNDRVSFDWLVHLDRPLTVDVDALTGAGDDSVMASWERQHEFRTGKVALTDYNFETGAGDDVVEIRVAPGEGVDALGAQVLVSSEDDPDRLGRVKVKFPFLGDESSSGEARVAGAEKLRLQTGSGDDRVTVDDVTGALRAMRLDVLTGAGDDELQYVPVGRFAQYLEESIGEGLQWAVFDGGEGNDRFALATSDRAELIEIEGVEVADVPDPLVRVTDLATSLATLQASVLATESIAVDSAGGDDAVGGKYTLFLPDGTPLRANVDLEVLTGEGDDSVSVEVLGGDDVAIDVDTQGGNDSIWIDLGHPVVTQEPPTRQLSLSGGAGNDFLDIAVSGESGGMDLVIDAGDGDDAVRFNPEEYTLSKDVNWSARIDTGDGDDVIDVNAVMGVEPEPFQPALNLDIRAGDGDDSVRAAMLLPAVQAAREAAHQVNVDLGDGDDALELEMHAVPLPEGAKPAEFKPAEFRVASGAGDDTVATSFFDVFFDIDVEIDSGDGDDFIDAVFAAPGPPNLPAGTIELDLGTGAGNDRAALLLPAVQAAREAANKVNVDTLQMDVLGTPPPDDTKPAEFRPAEFHILGGAGNDTVRYRYFAIIDRTTTAASSIGLFVDLGSGNDLAEIDIDTTGVAAGITPCWTIGVAGGAGGDQVGVQARGPFDEFDLSVDLGADANEVAIEKLTLTYEGFDIQLHASHQYVAAPGGSAAGAKAVYQAGLRSDGELVQALYNVGTTGGFVSDHVSMQIGGSLSLSVGNGGGEARGDLAVDYIIGAKTLVGTQGAAVEGDVRFKGGTGANALTVDLGANDAATHAGFANVTGLAGEVTPAEYRAGAEIGEDLALNVDMAGVDAFAFLTGEADDEIHLDLLYPATPVPALTFGTRGGDDAIGGTLLGVAGALKLALDTGDGDDEIGLSYTEAAALTTGAGAGGLPQVKTFSGASAAEGDSFFAYDPQFTGGVRVAVGDVNGDGVADLVTGAGPGGGPHVKVFDGRTGAEIRSFFAFAPSFDGGVFVAAGDVDGDGFADIVTGADAGGGPHVRVFSGATGAELRSFFAYAPSFMGGVRVASGDVNGDGFADIITGAGAGGGPHVKVFDGISGAELRGFFAYDPAFTGGVFVAAGDIDGDGAADVVTGADAGGGPHVKVFSGATGAELRSFFAYAPSFTGGVRVAAGDVNGDGFADIVTGSGPGAGPHVKVFDGRTGAELRSFFAYDPGFLGGVYVAAGDIDSDAPGTFDLALDTGAGNDAVTLQLTTGASRDDAIAADLGTGADRFELKWHGALQEPSAEVQLLLEVALGGADTLLPGVGDEVLISFEHGDPDRPLVLGTVWNSQDVPHDHKRLSMTLSSLDGSLKAATELVGGSGRDEVTLSYAGMLRKTAAGQIGALVDLGDGDDAAVLDFSGLTTEGPQTLAPINFDLRGGAGRNALSVTGTEGNDRFTLAERSVLLEGAADATFAGFDFVQVHALGGNDQVTMTGIDPRIDWRVDGGDGRDRFFAGFDGSFDGLTLADFELVKFEKSR